MGFHVSPLPDSQVENVISYQDFNGTTGGIAAFGSGSNLAFELEFRLLEQGMQFDRLEISLLDSQSNAVDLDVVPRFNNLFENDLQTQNLENVNMVIPFFRFYEINPDFDFSSVVNMSVTLLGGAGKEYALRSIGTRAALYP